MQLKFCIAKMIGTTPVYQTDTANTWVSDITNKSVEWYASEGAARNALQGPETFVVPYEDITMAARCDALLRACEALSEAVRVGAVKDVPEYAALYVPEDVYRHFGVQTDQVTRGEISLTEHGHIHDIPVCCQTLLEADE